MKYFALIALALFGIAVQRQVRGRLLSLYALVLIMFALVGCASTPPPAPATAAPKSLTCGDLPRDGSYLLLRCAQ